MKPRNLLIGICLIQAAPLLAACGQVVTAPAPTSAPTPALRALPTNTAAPTVSAVQYTPLPIPTPAPSATPVTYTIQAGDTLLGIAIRFGVTVEALLAVNPDINPTTISIDATLLIPPPDANPTPGFLPTPTPVPLALSAMRCYQTPTRGRLCLGEVRNEGSEPVTNVAVQVTLMLNDGQPGPSQVTYAPLDILWPGQTAPLSARFADARAASQAAAGLVLAADAANTLTDQFESLTPRNTSGAPGETTGYVVRGELINDQSSELHEIQVVVTLYNEDGSVRGFRQIRLPESMAAESTLPFEVAFLTRPDVVAGYAVVAQGRVP